MRIRRIRIEAIAIALCALTIAPTLVSAAGNGGAEEPPWRMLARDRRVVVETRTDANGTPLVRGRIHMDHGLRATTTALLDLEAFGHWVPGLRDWRVIERGSQHALVYGRHDLPWPLADRDYAVRYSWRQDADRFVLVAVSDPEAARLVEPLPGVVRLERVHTRWEVRALDAGHTHVEYTFAGDIAARRLPNFMLRYAWIDDVRDAFAGLEAEIVRAEQRTAPPPPAGPATDPGAKKQSGAPRM